MRPENQEDSNPTLVYLDPKLVARAQLNLGLSDKEIAQRCPPGKRNKDDNAMSNTTLKRVANCQGLTKESAFRLAKALEKRVEDLLAPWDLRYEPPPNPVGPSSAESEWVRDDPCLEPPRLASNGLCYVIFRMRHREITQKLGRGKFYNLSLMSAEKREAIRHQLKRHSNVCAIVGVHPHLAVNHSSQEVSGGWWVIDDWVGERTLADRLEEGAWPREKLPRLLYEIAIGLDALHQHQIVLRELAPSRVLISDQDERAVLTDFELAKLLDGKPSVSGEWPDDQYRAPEVETGVCTIQADLHSFGLVALACIGEEPSASARSAVAFGKAGVPKGVAKLLVDCLKPTLKDRPRDMSMLLRELARWAKK